MHDEIADEIKASIDRVFNSGNYILGKECEEFESRFSHYIGCKYAVGVNSGSDALYLTLKATGIKQGDEVITVSHTFISTVDAILRNGATPVLADIDPQTYCIDTDCVESLISSRTKAIIPVHLYGQPASMARLIELANKYELRIIEDACQAHGATYQGYKIGAMHWAGCFSFYPTKNLGCLGDGGMITTNDKELYDKLMMLRNYGQKLKYNHDIQGVNSRLDELQAAILSTKLRYLDRWNAQRNHIAKCYSEKLAGSRIQIPFSASDTESVFHLYVIRTNHRDIVKKMLEERHVQTLVHYPIPIHLQKAYYDFVRYKELSVTEKVCNEILSLPIFPGLTEESVVAVAEAIKSVLP